MDLSSIAKLRPQKTPETIGILPEALAQSRLIQSSELVVACKDNNFDKVERLLRESRVQILDAGVLDDPISHRIIIDYGLKGPECFAGYNFIIGVPCRHQVKTTLSKHLHTKGFDSQQLAM